VGADRFAPPFCYSFRS